MSIKQRVASNVQVVVITVILLALAIVILVRQFSKSADIPARMSNNVVFQTYLDVEKQEETALEAYDLNAAKTVSDFISKDSQFTPLYALYSPDHSKVLGAVDTKFGIAENLGDALYFSIADFRPEETDYQVIPSWLSDSSGLLIAVTSQNGSTTARTFYTYDLATRTTKKLVTLSSPGIYANLLGNSNERNEFYVSIMATGQNGGVIESISAYSLIDGSPKTLELSDDLKEKREVVVRGDYVIYNKPNAQEVNILQSYNLATKETKTIFTPEYVSSGLGSENPGVFIGGSAPYIYDDINNEIYMSAVDSVSKGVSVTKIVKVNLTNITSTVLYEETQNTLYSILETGAVDKDGRVLLYRRCLSECDQAPYNNQQLYSLNNKDLTEIVVSRKVSQYFGFEVR